MIDNYGNWDGTKLPYRPDLHFTGRNYLPVHADTASRIDPIDFEVIRHALWNVNEEHSQAIISTSPSPIAAIVHDLNAALLTEDAEYVYFAPYLQHLNAAADSAIKWTCENRAEQVGIGEGDVFITNDPWIGSNHQQDICMFAPIIVDGKLFAWVTNSLHQYDMGGTTPGSFCPDARSVFVEPSAYPPIKLVEAGRTRTDVEQLVARSSRMPQMVTLDLRSQLAGINVARQRMERLITTYGPDEVKAVMRKIIDDSETAFVEKLLTIPDGTWSELDFQESAFVGDRGVYRVQLNVTKHGDELIFSNEGTDEAIGALNTGYVGWKGGITAGIIPLLTFDQHFAIGGGLRHVRFEPLPNTITSASWPAPMSCGPSTAVHLTMKQSTQAINRILISSPILAEEVLCWGSVSQWPLMSVEGIDRAGEYYGSSILEPMIGGTGARWAADGVDSGGHTWDPKSSGANVEENEMFFPMLYLNRSEQSDSGAAGQFRGGNTVVVRFVPHGTDGINHSLLSGSQELAATSGIAGAHVGGPNRVRIARDTTVRQQMRDGVLASTMEDVGGTIENLPTKVRDVFQTQDDVYELIYNGGTGLGDALEREPESVAFDVSEGSTSPGAARALYGVVLDRVDDYEWTVDVAATAALRADRRAERGTLPIFGGAEPLSQTVDVGARSILLLRNLAVAKLGDSAVAYCTQCRHVVCGADQNYREFSRFDEISLQESNPLHLPANSFLDVAFVARRYFCPSCASLFDLEVCKPGAAPFKDVEIHAKALAQI